ncbi:Cytochrome P450 20A1 [Holothuria leucospilota]|uniref:Cytochrome P450 20A1 n=1 Tax=Holothuria leucospilota TaxID=206669 RepID=A0A9Q0YK89_HOLLE|nr:Cytochrome P450 20A1 [Holothuria leucospilota]
MTSDFDIESKAIFLIFSTQFEPPFASDRVIKYEFPWTTKTFCLGSFGLSAKSPVCTAKNGNICDPIPEGHYTPTICATAFQWVATLKCLCDFLMRKGSGNLPNIGAAGSLHEFLVKLHKQYGPIASFWYGDKFTVSVASPVMFKELKAVFDRPVEIFKLYEPMFGDESILFTNGTEGRLRRKTTDPAWGHDMLRHFCEIFNEIAEDTVAKLTSLPRQEQIPLCEQALTMSIKSLSRTSLGEYFKRDERCQNLKYHFEIAWHEMEQRLDGSIPEPDSERQDKLERALQAMYGMVRKIIKERQETPPPPHQRAFIDTLLEHPDMYPESTLLSEVLIYIVGGFHTSGYIFAWSLYLLAKHSDVQEKLYKEVISVVGRSSSIGPKDIVKFRYLKQVLNETLRVVQLVTFGAKVQDVDIQLGGFTIPKGTPIINALGVVYYDETIWPRPDKFDPERFSPENEKKRHPFAFQPFGLPARKCPGNRYTFWEVTVFLAILVRNFKWSLVEGQVIEKRYGLITSSKNEIWAQAERRE